MQSQNEDLNRFSQQARKVEAQWLAIAEVPFGDKSVVENGILMAGDAAGLIPPLTGDGISMALESGQPAASFAARQLAGGLQLGELERLYPHAWQLTFRARIRLARCLQPLLMAPLAGAAVLRVLGFFPGLGQALVAGTRGK